jgi:hypothetical protein
MGYSIFSGEIKLDQLAFDVKNMPSRFLWKGGEQAEKKSRKSTQEVMESGKKRKKPAPSQPP